MVHDGCWSTVICSARERTELGDTSDNGWVLGCRLSIGHRGDHATDAENVPRFDRRLWLEWNDHEQHAQSLIDRNPCTGGVGARCMLFEGHGGGHWYAPTNGYLTSAGTGRRRAEETDLSGGSNVATVAHAPDLTETGAHREDETAHGHLDVADTSSSIADLVDMPNLRGRAVRGAPPTDELDDIGPAAAATGDLDSAAVAGVTHHDGSLPSVGEALDAVVAALAQLAEALRRNETRR